MVTGKTVEDIVREVVGSVAPGERAYFDELSTMFFDDPDRALRAGTSGDLPAGFGALGLQALVTTIMLGVFYEYASSQVKDATGALARRGRRWLRRRRALKNAILTMELPDYSEQTAIEIRELTVRKAVSGGCDRAMADQVGTYVYEVIVSTTVVRHRGDIWDDAG